MWLKNVVVELQKKYNTRDPFELATRLNINVLGLDLHKEINGFYKYDRRNQYIIYNSNLSDEMKIVVCAHELGHAILHPRSNTPFMRTNTFFSINQLEREANLFAAELLIPDDLQLSYDQITISHIASLHNVPLELAKLKCEKLFL